MDNLLKDALVYWEVAKHLKTWVTNLKRARDNRKKESIEALRQVIVSGRGMRVYINELSEEWAKFSYLLKDRAYYGAGDFDPYNLRVC